MKNQFLAAAFLASSLLTACDGDNVEENETNVEITDTDTLVTASGTTEKLENEGIRLVPFTGSSEFPEASLSMEKPEEGKSMKSGKQVFQFKVNNYNLGEQTENSSNMQLANSGKGQHIHVIVDNNPYSAHYNDTAVKALSDGEHVVLAFLSRSYHESVKNENSFVVRAINVGDSTKTTFDKSGQHLFYSRPKGTYKGEETENLLLDFFLVNTDLGKDNQVKIWIDGKDFLVTEWRPYIVQGLEKGTHTFRIQLVSNGNPVAGPFNDSGERTVTLE